MGGVELSPLGTEMSPAVSSVSKAPARRVGGLILQGFHPRATMPQLRADLLPSQGSSCHLCDQINGFQNFVQLQKVLHQRVSASQGSSQTPETEAKETDLEKEASDGHSSRLPSAPRGHRICEPQASLGRLPAALWE